jgi:hypothetical protein
MKPPMRKASSRMSPLISPRIIGYSKKRKKRKRRRKKHWIKVTYIYIHTYIQ